MSEIKVNKITPKQNCTQVTLGDSGDTFVIPSGVTITNNGTQTGFGRTGTVDWDTTAKTAAFTAVSGNGYFVNTTSGAITVTLPATPSAGDIVSVKDYAQTFNTNNVTLARNGSNIEGAAGDITLDGQAESVTFVYVDSTKGWVLVGESLTKYGAQYVTATGGTVTCCGDYKIHTFTGPGTFTVTCAGNPAGSTTVDYLVVAGGGGGGTIRGGGGGAGGYRESSGAASGCYTVSPLGACVSALPVSVTAYPITVGGGGTGNSSPNNLPSTQATAGAPSTFSTITSTGGGFGGNNTPCAHIPGTNGGSGGGAAGQFSAVGGTGNTPPVSPPQGNNGGNDTRPGSPPGEGGAGGGGATAVGVNSQSGNAGCGGAGATTSISASPVAYAGGGGGGTSTPLGACAGAGGTGGGGAGGDANSYNGTNGTTNTGGGGGGTGQTASPNTGGNGGSGIVIIRYRFQ
jgi:hypothetical protein